MKTTTHKPRANEEMKEKNHEEDDKEEWQHALPINKLFGDVSFLCFHPNGLYTSFTHKKYCVSIAHIKLL